MADLYLRFKLRVEAGDNGIQTCIFALAVTPPHVKMSNAFRSCFWRTSLGYIVFHRMVM